MKRRPGSQPSSPPSAPRPQTVTVQTTQMMSGPLPSPAILAQYNTMLPGAADRIIAMAENDSAHLQTLEKMTVTSFYVERRTGQIFGFCIALLGLAASVYLAMNNHEVTASVIGGTTIVGLVSIFVVGRLTHTNNVSHPSSSNQST